MTATFKAFQLVGLLIVVCSGCQTRHSSTKEDFIPPVEEVERFWVWYWQIIEAERDSTAPDSKPITPPPLDKLAGKRLREIEGVWGCDARWNDADDPNAAVIEFLPRSGFRINWKDGEESGIWIARSCRLELYKRVLRKPKSETLNSLEIWRVYVFARQSDWVASVSSSSGS